MKNQFYLIPMIAILAGMLLPALNSARERAKTLSCLSNLKQLGHITNAYMDEFDGLLFPAYIGSAAATTGQDFWSGMLYCNGYSTSMKGMFCTNMKKHWSQKMKFENNIPDKQSVRFTYGCRSIIKKDDGSLITKTQESCFSNKKPLKGLAISKHILIADSKLYVVEDPEDPESPYYFLSSYGTQQRIGLRHKGKANLLFADGHAESLNRTAISRIGDVFDTRFISEH